MSADEVLVERFADQMRLRGLSASTIKRRRWTLRTFLAESGLSWADVELDDVEAFMASRSTPATRRAILGDLRAFYRWATRRGLVDVDPTTAIDSPKVPKRAPSPLTRDELRRAWEAAGFELRCILALGARAGLRVSEIAALDAADVDHERRVIVVRNGKGGKDRVVPLSSQLSALLIHAGPGPIVPYSCGGSVSNVVRAHFAALGIRKRAHDLRATFATEAARAGGGDVLTVQALLGHSSPQTTMRYVQYTPEGAAVVERLYDDEPTAVALP